MDETVVVEGKGLHCVHNQNSFEPAWSAALMAN
jgi:hypothetical protein